MPRPPGSVRITLKRRLHGELSLMVRGPVSKTGRTSGVGIDTSILHKIATHLVEGWARPVAGFFLHSYFYARGSVFL